MKKQNEPYRNPFRVPDNYFDEVNQRIISAAAADKKIVKSTVFERFRTQLLVAASIAGLVLLGYTALKLFSPDKSEQRASIIVNEFNIESFIDDIDISTLEENASSLVSEQVPDVPHKDIIDYLLLENIELTDIYAKL
jgi:hypothetical protein